MYDAVAIHGRKLLSVARRSAGPTARLAAMLAARHPELDEEVEPLLLALTSGAGDPEERARLYYALARIQLARGAPLHRRLAEALVHDGSMTERLAVALALFDSGATGGERERAHRETRNGSVPHNPTVRHEMSVQLVCSRCEGGPARRALPVRADGSLRPHARTGSACRSWLLIVHLPFLPSAANRSWLCPELVSVRSARRHPLLPVVVRRRTASATSSGSERLPVISNLLRTRSTLSLPFPS